MELKLDHIDCGYGDKVVIRDLCCTFHQGEAIAVLGPNGVGKSTIIKNILQQFKLLKGRILLENRDIRTYSLKELATHIAYVPQIRECTYNYSVIEVVMMGRASYLSIFSSPKEEEYRMAMDVLKAIEMEDYAERNYSQLSGGEQQMVLIARAIIQDTSFILMDEPASNLDFYNQRLFLRCIQLLKQKDIGIIFVSHIPEHAFACCEKVLMMKLDRSYLFGDTQTVLTEENLKSVYNTNISLLEKKNDEGELLRACCIFG